MIDQFKVQEKLQKLNKCSKKEKEKILYEWVLNRSITLGEFRALLEKLKQQEYNEHHSKSTVHSDNN